MMVSWQFQQRIRRIKEKIAVVAKNKTFILAIVFIALFAAGFYINTYTARVVELKETAETKLSECQEKLSDYEKNATALQQQLSFCISNNTLLQTNFTILQTNFNVCTEENRKLTSQYKNISFDLASCQADYSSLTKALNELNSTFEQLVKSSATNICCKRKIDEPSLKYFYIKEGIIYCTSEYDENLGTKQFVCPSLTS